MLLARSKSSLSQRRGAILLVVLTLIALFSIVALSFAIYAESEALAARTRREAAATTNDPPPANLLASVALGQMLYPAGDSENALLSAVRGYDMATMVYGNNPNAVTSNTIPYNGIGTVYQDLSGVGITGLTDRRQIINYSLQIDRTANTSIVFEPENLPSALADVRRGTISRTVVGVPSPPNSIPVTSYYVGRNAPYTYPDRNNVYVAVQDPQTGRIIKQSYVSPHFGTLAQANPNWTNPVGKFMTIRPRPFEHIFDAGDGRGPISDFPFPPANPDGSVTGDVQNIVQTDGVQRNDSVWVDMGLPVVNHRGRPIKPMVAATILPLDARVNANVAGNQSGGNSIGSTNGFGPWEIGLNKIIPNNMPNYEASAVVSSRTGGSNPNPRGTTLAQYPYPAFPQNYAKVNWDGAGAMSAMQIPTQGNATYTTVPASDPTYPTPGYGDVAESTGNVPQMFNPYSWNAFTSPSKLFPHTDLRRASMRYAGKPYDYDSPFFGASAPNSLSGTGSGNNAKIRRALLTTISNSISKPKFSPNIADYTRVPNQLTYDPLTNQLISTPHVLPPTVPMGPITDFAGANTVRNIFSQLGSLDLNRTLVDYRTDPNLSLADPVNAGIPMQLQEQAATADRNTLARAIFARLILATGAKARVVDSNTINLPDPANSFILNDGGPAPSPTATPQEYDALRYLAQIAVNIVDQRDSDDINTPFVWNPLDITAPIDPANFAPTELTNRVVFGVEKPRLILNEAYSEVTNDQGTRGQNTPGPNFEVRFWLELINTTNADSANTPLAGIPQSVDPSAQNGNIPFNYNLPSMPYNFGGPAPSPYRIQIFKNGAAAVSDLQNPTTITGDIANAPDREFDCSGLIHSTQPNLRWSIEPNNGQAQAVDSTSRNGIAVLGPQLQPDPSGAEYVPTNTSLLTDDAANGVRLYYTSPATDQNGFDMLLPTLADHTVVLRRLANPYLPSGPTNPYLTVDYMTHVHSEDAVRVVRGPLNTGVVRMPAMMSGGMNFLQIQNRESLGRIQPYMAAEGAQNMVANGQRVPANQAMSCVVLQNPIPAPTTEPKATFFRHNSQTLPMSGTDQTIRLPFEWLPHFDRPFINQIELLHATDARAHQLTHRFASIGPIPHQHSVPWTTTPLYRALEMLEHKPWGYGLAHQARVPGKININMIWHQAVLEALLDRNDSNVFQDTDVLNLYYNQTDPTQSLIFGTGTFARTKDATTFVPNATVDEEPAPISPNPDLRDRPFKSLGAAVFQQGGYLPHGSSLQETILRDGATVGTPAILTNLATSPAITHPYQRTEMLRKMFNNMTTTTDTYLVVMTIGYFEVRNPNLSICPISVTNPVILGKEVSDPDFGNMRSKFVAVIDRSMLAANSLAPAPQAVGPWQSEIAISNPPPAPPPGSIVVQFRASGVVRHPADLAANIPAIHIPYDGKDYFVVATPITSARVANDPFTTTSLVFGTGSTLESGSVVSLGYDFNGNSFIEPNEQFDPATGIATVYVTGITRQPAAGTLISNGIPQNPGPQPAFDVNSSRYQGVVPYFEQVEIGK